MRLGNRQSSAPKNGAWWASPRKACNGRGGPLEGSFSLGVTATPADPALGDRLMVGLQTLTLPV